MSKKRWTWISEKAPWEPNRIFQTRNKAIENAQKTVNGEVKILRIVPAPSNELLPSKDDILWFFIEKSKHKDIKDSFVKMVNEKEKSFGEDVINAVMSVIKRHKITESIFTIEKEETISISWL